MYLLISPLFIIFAVYKKKLMKKLIYNLIIALFLGNYCFAQNNVIEPELQEFISQSNDEMISVNIIFKAQMDENELNDRADYFENKKARREFVVNELKHFSEKSQQEVLSIIQSEQRNGKVTNIVSHWLSNSITCTTTKDVIYLLSERDDILIIGHNADKNAILSGQQSAVSGQQSVKAEAEIEEHVSQVNAPQVWDQGYTGEGVLVAILDTGVNYEHPDLADHLWDGGSQYPNHGYNSYDGSNITMDNRGHGTHCAGIICGDGTGDKQTGIAPDVTLMCIKTLNDNGNTNASAICAGMEFAVEHGAEVLSMSLGIANSSVADREMIRQTCVNTLQAGVIASVAAGNEGNSQNNHPIPDNVRVPGSCPAPWIHPDQQENAGELSCVVSVGAVNKNDNVATVSSRGPVTWQNTSFGDYPYNPGIGLIRPDVCAPGVDIVSLNYSDNGYTKKTGTSQAAPNVAGIICLMLSKKPEMTPAEISMVLETSAFKLEDNKNNNSGSGRVDALAAINAIDMGDIVFNEMTFIDDNANGKINPGEEINFNMVFENISSETINNITAKLTCDNEWINITKAESEITSISANGTTSVENAFTIEVDEDALGKTKLYFDVEFYDGNNMISKTRFIETIYSSIVRYSSITIENDDNGNGIIEPTETADLRVHINNEGNEMALGLTGILSCNNNTITINNAETEFDCIAPDGSASALFNVSVGEVGGVTNIPLSLEIKDKFNRTKVFDINYEINCNVIYTLKDEFGDGWNGAEIIAHYSDGSADDTYTISNGSMETFTKTLNSGVTVSLEWKNGGLDSECSYSVKYENGVEIYSGKGRQQGIFFSWVYDCSCQSMIFENCEGVKNLNITSNNNFIELKWEATEDALYYEVYRDTEIIATTEELSFTDNNLETGTYYYNVRPVYENCYGALSGEEIIYTVNIDEINTSDVTIYPNPAKDFIKLSAISCQHSVIKIYNYLGMLMDEIGFDSDEMEINISDYNPGVYFINIKSEDRTTVKKIVKY